jgi:UDP-glucuronate 4-epimerase
MTEERFLVTGASGCIGAWVVRNLVRQNIPTAALSLSGNPHRLRLIMSADEMARVHLIKGDIVNLDTLVRAVEGFGATHVIHLAALQLPFCKADPPLGARVNVVGTVNIFEAVKRAGLSRVAYASSTAVYGPGAEYPAGPLAHDAPLKPRSHYGVYKQANEGSARVYWLEDGISSIGLRPYVVYGPGRDQGMTSTPTKAMLAAAAGRPYHISYGGRFCFQYADDTAQVFIAAARSSFEGADVFNIGGDSVAVPDIVEAIERAQPSARGQVTFSDTPLPFPAEVDNAALRQVLGLLPHTPLDRGVAETIAVFRQALAEGRIALDNLK